MNAINQLETTEQKPMDSHSSKTVSSISYHIRWFDGYVNPYLQSQVQKELRCQPGILGVIFSTMSEDLLKIDYDPRHIDEGRIFDILQQTNLGVLTIKNY